MIIEKLQNTDLEVARQMKSVFMDSYAIEAKLLEAIDFPPLKRALETYMNCGNDFFGYFIDEELAGIIEINHKIDLTHIQSLVVLPKYFRKGIARNLMAYVMELFEVKPFMVETGVKNEPAIALYEKFDFVEVLQWDTDHGVRKVRFERRLTK